MECKKSICKKGFLVFYHEKFEYGFVVIGIKSTTTLLFKDDE
jgi:hypothetical protein